MTGVLCGVMSAWAQQFPSRPITLINPFQAGPTDTQLRKLAEITSRHLGQPIAIVSKPGAGGMLGPVSMAKTAKPDGYTLSQLTIGVLRLPHMQKMMFNPLSDFTYIACLTGYTFGMAVRADSPFKSIKDMVAFAKANPGKFTYGSTGTGTTPHLAVEEFAMKAGIELQHVPFKGSSDGLQALLGGHIAAHSDATGWAPHVDAGTMRLLATYGSKRTKRWSQVPTLNELGFETVSDSPFGIGAPRGMEPALTKRLDEAFKKALEDPQVISSFEKYDQPVIYMGSDEYARFAQRTFVSEKRLIEKLGLAKAS
jgi:tripartite-type tricarboxylate transporter receptor subunit TctC